MDEFPRRTREVISGTYVVGQTGVIVLDEKPSLLVDGQKVEITVEVTVMVRPVTVKPKLVEDAE